MSPNIQILAERTNVDLRDPTYFRIQYTETIDGRFVKSIRYLRVIPDGRPDSEDNVPLTKCWLEGSTTNIPFPELPSGEWDIVDIIRDEATSCPIACNARSIEVMKINPWHPVSVDYFELGKTVQLSNGYVRIRRSDNLWVVRHSSSPIPMVMKISEFPFLNLESIRRETDVYRFIDGRDIAPQFMAHVTENGRIIGFLTAYVEDGTRPVVERNDRACEDALQKLHDVGLLHKDVHKGNFLMRLDGTATLIDFESAVPCPRHLRCFFDEEMRERKNSFWFE